jgi:hypothetical protein
MQQTKMEWEKRVPEALAAGPNSSPAARSEGEAVESAVFIPTQIDCDDDLPPLEPAMEDAAANPDESSTADLPALEPAVPALGAQCESKAAAQYQANILKSEGTVKELTSVVCKVCRHYSVQS